MGFKKIIVELNKKKKIIKTKCFIYFNQWGLSVGRNQFVRVNIAELVQMFNIFIKTEFHRDT